MLRMLRFDLYKIFKSKALLSVFIIILCIAFLDPFLFWAIYPNNVYEPVVATLSRTIFLHISIWIFVIPFISKDFSSKYIKNTYATYSSADKIYYILSKVIYIFALCVICFFVHFLSNLFENLIHSAVAGREFMFEKMEEYGGDGITAAQGIYQYFCLMMNCFAKGTFCMFLCMLLKKEYFVLIVVLPYGFFLSDLLCSALNGAILGQSSYWKGDLFYGVEQYTIYRMYNVLVNAQGAHFMRILTQSLLVSLGYGVLFTGASWLCFFKRSF